MEDLMIHSDPQEQPAQAESATPEADKAAALKAKLDSQIRAVSQRVAIAYGEIVAVLARAPKYRHLSLADLEWLVLPPLLANQFRVVSGQVKGQAGMQVPLGVAFWAYVSPEVAAKLEAQKRDGALFRLAPQEWKGGDIPWLLDIIAPPEAARAMYKQLRESVFKKEEPRGIKLPE
jgi:hemolysin-activating ACP:hemolysin acyltransferase